jgi:NCS1 family nucleobase:cation symporter-1
MADMALEQTILPDGRVELSPEVDAGLGVSRLHNEDLAPVPVGKRTWTTYNYFALWVGMAHNIPTWTLAAGLVVLGMAWYQAVFTIMVANIIVLIPMLANSHAGTKFGIPFPVFARGSFGVFGANLPAMVRAGVACGWFGIQTWIGGSAVFVVMAVIFTKLLGAGNFWTNAQTISIGMGDPEPWTKWLSFAIFWALNVAIIIRGMEAVRRFENWAAPFVLIVAIFLLVWMTIQAGGFGPLVEDHGTVGWSLDKFWFGIFPPALMGMIAFWSTLSLNMPDFTRFGRSQREQAIGQALGLPTTMTLFPLIAVLVTSASIKVYGQAIWDPVELVGKFDNVLVVILALVTLGVATLSVNVAANLVSPSYDFSNLWPKRISFRTGGLITAVIGILIQPWMLYQNPHTYIFTWLGTYGGATGAIAGVLIADYWWMRKRRFHLAALYRSDGKYRYAGGWNWIAVVSLLVGIFIAIGGSYSNLNKDGTPGGPFPPGGIFGFLKAPFAFADYSWVAGLIVSFVLYGILTIAFGNKDARYEEDDVAKAAPAAAA